jgi:hypothetical protein
VPPFKGIAILAVFGGVSCQSARNVAPFAPAPIDVSLASSEGGADAGTFDGGAAADGPQDADGIDRARTADAVDAGDGAREEREPATYAKPVADPKAWLRALGATAPVVRGDCFEVQAGVPLRPALICRARSESDLSHTLERVYRMDGGKAVEVWSGLVAIHANWVDIVVEIAPDGSRLVARDRYPCRCEGAQREDGEKRRSRVQPQWLSDDLSAACRGRGVYVWSGRRYVRDREASGAAAPDCTRFGLMPPGLY